MQIKMSLGIARHWIKLGSELRNLNGHGAHSSGGAVRGSESDGAELPGPKPRGSARDQLIPRPVKAFAVRFELRYGAHEA